MRRLLFAGLLALSCAPRETIDPQPSEAVLAATPRTGNGRVVLVTIDGVRWQDVFMGSDPVWSGAPAIPAPVLVPNLYTWTSTRGLRIGGAPSPCGTVHTAGKANVSLPGYLEIFTGRPTHCLDNECKRPAFTVFDQAARGGVPAVASFVSWQRLERAVTSQRPDAPVLVSTGPTSYRADADTAALALAYLRDARPGFLHVGLGDTDESGHADDYPAYLRALRAADAFVGDLAMLLDSQGELGRTTVIVTPDHGRESGFKEHGALFPESGRTFVFAFGASVERHGEESVCPKDDITLLDIAPTVRTLLGLVADPSVDAGRPITPIVTGPPPEEEELPE